MVDLEPQYATLKGARGATPELPLSATLNRKKYGDPQPMAGNFCSLVYSFLEVCLIFICYGEVVLVYNNCQLTNKVFTYHYEIKYCFSIVD